MSKNTDLGNLVNGLFVSSTRNVGVGTTTPLLTATDRGNLTINGATSSILTLGVANGYSAYFFADASKVELSTNAQPMTFVTNGVERMRITSAGNVGIGTTSPASLLHLNASGYPAITIQGGSTAGGGLRFLAGSDTYAELYGEYESANNGMLLFRTRGSGTLTERMRITSGGAVGIGTTSPSHNLSVRGSNATDMISWTDAINNTGYLGIRGGGVVWMNADNNLVLATSNTERMRITSGGNVGIGNTSPSTKLHVTGTVSSVELIMSGSGSFSYSTNSSWSSHQLIVPSGVLSGGGVYLIRIQWGSGDAPYIVYATGLWQPVQSNGGSADAEVALLCSSHQGVGTAIFIRNQSVGGQATSALYARLVNFPQLVGSITTTVSRLM